MKFNTGNGMDFTDAEYQELCDILHLEERAVIWPYKNFIGAYSEAIVFDADEDFIDVELIHGVQSESWERSETLKLKRDTMEWVD